MGSRETEVIENREEAQPDIGSTANAEVALEVPVADVQSSGSRTRKRSYEPSLRTEPRGIKGTRCEKRNRTGVEEAPQGWLG